MSDDNIFREDIVDQDRVYSKAADPSKIEKALRWIIMIALIILGGELIMILLVNPCLPFSKVEVIGMPELDRSMVLEKAGITMKSSYLSVNPRSVERRLQSLVVIESVKVLKRFPDSLRITLEGRKAVAMSFAVVQNRVSPVFFDKEGLVFMIGTTGQAMAPSLSVPIISGIMLEQPFLGMRLPGIFSTLLSNLEAIHSAAPELLGAISEIQVYWNAYDRYELLLYPIHSPVRIRLGSELNETLLRYVLLVVDVCVSKGVKIEEIDFRTGTASYTIKGASSG
jgi:cell division protein FtsQ